MQPWEFVIAASPATKRNLAVAAYGQRPIEAASAVIVVCANQKLSQESYGERGRSLYCLQDTAAAIQNILLAACALGLGTCWIGAFKEEEIRKVINAPKDVKPIALIPIGYPAEAPPTRNRRPISEIMHEETF